MSSLTDRWLASLLPMRCVSRARPRASLQVPSHLALRRDPRPPTAWVPTGARQTSEPHRVHRLCKSLESVTLKAPTRNIVTRHAPLLPSSVPQPFQESQLHWALSLQTHALPQQ